MFTHDDSFLDKPTAKIMLLGTFHFQDAGLDAYKPQFAINIYSEQRQEEVTEVVECLARFRPTKIAIERRPDHSEIMKVVYAFIRAAFHDAAIYRLEFWGWVLSTFIMMYASYSLWEILYRQDPNAFGLDLAQMTTYAALGMLLLPVLEAATTPQYYIAEQVRQGTVEMDLVKPLDFIPHMLYRSLGAFCVQLLLIGLPGVLFATLFLGFQPPVSWQAGVGFAISLALGYLIFFGVSMLMGMLSVVTLNIHSYNWAYWSLVRFTSGQLVPLWVYPPLLGALAAALPFKSIFFVPMSIYIGAQEGSLAEALLSQAVWASGLFVLASLAWGRMQRRVVIQGG